MAVTDTRSGGGLSGEQADELAAPIATLRTAIARLESELHGLDAYRALVQLDQREAAGDGLSVIDAGELRRLLTAELAGYQAYRAKLRLDRALRLLEQGEIAEPAPAPVDGNVPRALAIAALVPEPATLGPATAPVTTTVTVDVSGVSESAHWVAEAIASAFEGRAAVPVEVATTLETAPEPVAPSVELPPATAVPEPIMTAEANELPVASPASAAPVLPLAARFPSETDAREAEAAIFASLARLKVPMATRAADAPPPAPDRLELIAGLDEGIRRALAAEGIDHFAQIARWSAVDIAQISSRLGLSDLVARLGWIEQAALLARGVETLHARRRRQGWLAVSLSGATAIAAPQPAGNPTFFRIGLTDAFVAELPFEAEATAARVVVVTEEDPGGSPSLPGADLPSVAEEVVIRPRRRDLPMAGAMANVAAAVAATEAAAKNLRGATTLELPPSGDRDAEVIIRTRDPVAQDAGASVWTAADAVFLPSYRRDAHGARPVDPSPSPGASEEALVEIRHSGEPRRGLERSETSAKQVVEQPTILRRLVRSLGRDERPW